MNAEVLGGIARVEPLVVSAVRSAKSLGDDCRDSFGEAVDEVFDDRQLRQFIPAARGVRCLGWSLGVSRICCKDNRAS